MVFANLDEEDREAFFELLDEYFATRPELAETLQLTRTGLRIDSTSNSNQNNVVKKPIIPPSSRASSTTSTRPPPSTLSKPPAIPRRVNSPATSNSITANNISDDGNGSDSPKLARLSPSPSVNSNQDLSNELSSTVGRIAAARLAFNNNSNNNNNANSNSNSNTDPNTNTRPMPPPPRRVASTSSDVSTGKRKSLAVPPPRPSLSPQQKSRETNNKPDTRPSWVKTNNDDDNEIDSPALVTPSSLRASRQNSSIASSTPTFAPMPPPPRRVAPPRRVVSRLAPEPEPEPEPEEAPQYEEAEEEEEAGEGEWAEVIYDYTSSDPTDLELKEGQHVLIKERTSDDWWTAELNNKSGLIPAAYVKVL